MKHIDEVCAYIRKALLESEVKSKATILDVFWTADYTDAMKYYMKNACTVPPASERALAYFRGDRPKTYGSSWDDLDFIYFPLNMENKHWVAVEIDLQEWKANVYDCNVALYPDLAVENCVHAICRFLPHFMTQYPPLAKKFEQRGTQEIKFE